MFKSLRLICLTIQSKYFSLSLLILLNVCANNLAHASIPADSLIAQLKFAKTDTNKVLLLNELARTFIYTDPNRSLSFSAEADSLASLMSFTRGRALSLNSIGAAYWSLGDLEEGLAYFIKSKNLAKEINDTYLIGKNQGNIGIIYGAAGNRESAIMHYREALSTFLEIEHKERIAVTYNNLGKAYLELSQYDSAQYYLELAEPMAREARESLLPIVYFNLADTHYRQGQYSKAKEWLKFSEKIAIRRQEKRALVRSKQMLAEICRVEGRLQAAFDLASTAVRLAETTAIKELQYITYETYANIFAELGQYDSAYYYQRLFTDFKNSLTSKTNQEKLNLMQYDHQRQEIDLLTREKEREVAMSKQQKSRIFMLYGLLLTTALLILVLYRSYYLKIRTNKEMKIWNEEIERQKENIIYQSAKLEELNRTKDKLLSIISHDLKSPLNSILGSLNLLERGLISTDEFTEFIPGLSRNVNYTSSLLENLLYWARNQLNGGTSVNPEKVDLNAVASDKIELLKPQAAHKEVSLDIEVSDTVYAFADDIMIQIVLQNLISNAIKFCRAGDRITVFAYQQENQSIVCVQDTGAGIAHENLKELFSKKSFTTRGTDNEKGTGLGLQLCYDFVEKNNGEIWVESEPGLGSAFYFSLPIYRTLPKEV